MILVWYPKGAFRIITVISKTPSTTGGRRAQANSPQGAGADDDEDCGAHAGPGEAHRLMAFTVTTGYSRPIELKTL